MDEAFELGGEGHVNDKNREEKDLPGFADARAQFASFPVEFHFDSRRKNSPTNFLGFFDGLAESASLRLATDLGATLAGKVGDGVD